MLMPEDQLPVIEAAIDELMAAFDVNDPPIPIEIMLQRPKAGMWKEVNLSELSTAFINVKQRYSPRMSVARLLARLACRSEWGDRHNLGTVGSTDESLRALARAVLMPRSMLDRLAPPTRTPKGVTNGLLGPGEDDRRRANCL